MAGGPLNFVEIKNPFGFLQTNLKADAWWVPPIRFSKKCFSETPYYTHNTHHEHQVDDHFTGEEGVNQNWKLMLKIVLLSYCHTLVEKCPPNDPLIEQPG